MNRTNIIVITILSLAVVYLLVHVHFFSGQKYAYIDTGKLMENYTSLQNVRAKMKLEASKNQSNVDTLTMEFEKALKKHEKSYSTMSAKEKQLSEELMRTKQDQLVQYQQATKQKLMAQEQQLSQEAISVANNLITEYGKRKGYSIIFATSNGSLAYAEKGLDITDNVLEVLNKK